MKNVIDFLARYISVLNTSLQRTHRAEDRPEYVRHLAGAAVLFSLVQLDASEEAILEHVKNEERAFGLSYLSYREGELATAAFVTLAAIVRQAYRD